VEYVALEVDRLKVVQAVQVDPCHEHQQALPKHSGHRGVAEQLTDVFSDALGLNALGVNRQEASIVVRLDDQALSHVGDGCVFEGVQFSHLGFLQGLVLLDCLTDDIEDRVTREGSW